MASPAEALRQLYSGYVRALEGASDFLRDDLPDASPGVSRWVQGVGRRACRKYARQRGGVPFLTSDPTWDGICSGYWDSINEGPEEEGAYAPSFTGGQCAISYRVTIRTVSIQVPDPPFSPGGDTLVSNLTSGGNGQFPIGPIRGLQLIQATSDVCGGGFANLNMLAVVADGGIYPFGCFAKSATPGNYQLQSYAITEITPRFESQLDNCGDPPPEYRPPRFPTNLPPLEPPTVPAPGLGDDWEVNILPDGEINICIGGECSIGTPPAGGGGPDSGRGPGEPDGAPQETDPNDPDAPNEVSGCVEDGNLLTGLKITFTQIPPYQAPLGDIYYRVCWVWMGPDSDKLDMVIDGRTMQNGQFVIPDSGDCTCYKVRANAGWRLEVQAYSRPKEE